MNKIFSVIFSFIVSVGFSQQNDSLLNKQYLDSMELYLLGESEKAPAINISLDENDSTFNYLLFNLQNCLMVLKENNYSEELCIDSLFHTSYININTQMINTLLIANTYARYGDIDNAISCYDEIIQMDKHLYFTPYCLYKIGFALDLFGRKNEAEEFYNQLKKEFPFSKEAILLIEKQ